MRETSSCLATCLGCVLSICSSLFQPTPKGWPLGEASTASQSRQFLIKEGTSSRCGRRPYCPGHFAYLISFNLKCGAFRMVITLWQSKALKRVFQSELCGNLKTRQRFAASKCRAAIRRGRARRACDGVVPCVQPQLTGDQKGQEFPFQPSGLGK